MCPTVPLSAAAAGHQVVGVQLTIHVSRTVQSATAALLHNDEAVQKCRVVLFVALRLPRSDPGARMPTSVLYCCTSQLGTYLLALLDLFVIATTGGPDYTAPSRNLALELVRVTEAAALAAARW